MARGWKLTAAGILNIVAGILYILVLVLLWRVLSFVGPRIPGPQLFILLAIPGVAIGALTVVGGICALRGKMWGLAFAGSIFALLFPFLGLPAGIFLVQSRDDWSRGARRLVLGILIFLAIIVIGFYVLAQFL